MTPCHLLPASGQAGRHSQTTWLQSLHLAAPVPVEGNIQFPSPATKWTIAMHTVSGLLRAEDMEPCNNSKGEEAGNFLNDRRLLCLFANTAGPAFLVSTTHRNSALFPGSLQTEMLNSSFIQSLVFAYVHCS